MQSKHKQELKYLLIRYGHRDIAQALVELSKRQEEAEHPNQQWKAAATQRVHIWQQAYESLQALSQHLATAKQLAVRKPKTMY